jgi:hypothetical protein
MDRLIKKANYFDYSTGEIRKHVNQGEGYGKERISTASREHKCILVKEFILYYENKRIKVFDSSAKGEEEYCGPCQLSRITPFPLSRIKNPTSYYYKKCLVFRCLPKRYCRFNLEEL